MLGHLVLAKALWLPRSKKALQVHYYIMAHGMANMHSGDQSTVILTKYYASPCAVNSIFWILTRVFFFISPIFHIFCQTPKTAFVGLAVSPSTGTDPLTTHGRPAGRFGFSVSHTTRKPRPGEVGKKEMASPNQMFIDV